MESTFCEDTQFYSIIEWVTISSAFLSLIVLCFLIYNYCKTQHNQKQDKLISNLLFIIVISEIINAIDKIASFFYAINTRISKQKTFIHIQIGFDALSDSLTLLSSFFIALKTYELTNYKMKFFKTIFKNNISIYFIIIFSFCLATISTVINSIFYDEELSPSKTCKVWYWFISAISLALYAYYISIVVLILIVSVKTIKELRQKELLALAIDNNNINSNENDSEKNKRAEILSLCSQKIKTLISKIRRFPIVSACIWIIVAIDRVPDDILNQIGYGNNIEYFYTKSSVLMVVKYIILVLHNIIGCMRGFLYAVVYFSKEKDFLTCFHVSEEKLFENNAKICDSVDSQNN